MQPITQASLGPKLNGIRHLRADQSMVGVIGTASCLQEITRFVRILQPLSAWIRAEPGHSKPQCFDDSRDAKNDSIWAARREMQRRIPPCTESAWALQTAKGTSPKTRKTRGKPGFYQRRGQEPNFFMFSQCFKGSSKGTDLL